MKTLLSTPLLFIAFTFYFGNAFAQQFTFQGKVYNNNAPVNSNGAIFQFTLLNAAPAWTETQNNIPIRNGYYAVVLGSVTPLPLNLFASSQSRQLSIRYAGNLIDTVTIYAPFERDYTVPANIKDGISWDEISGKPDYLTTKLADILQPPGTVQAFAGDSSEVPVGWLICDGRVLDSSTINAPAGRSYGRLYKKIKNNWGGTNATNFRLPDLRGRFLRGQSNGGDTTDVDRNARTAKYAGGATGNRVGSYQLDAFQGHRHHAARLINQFQAGNGDLYGITSMSAPNFTSGNYWGTGDPLTDGLHQTPRISSESRPRNAAVHYIIKL